MKETYIERQRNLQRKKRKSVLVGGQVAMDYRLHAQRTYICGDRRFKIGYNAWRQFPVSLGAALANNLSGSDWI
jgi:hypothetical protein